MLEPHRSELGFSSVSYTGLWPWARHSITLSFRVIIFKISNILVLDPDGGDVDHIS